MLQGQDSAPDACPRDYQAREDQDTESPTWGAQEDSLLY